MMIIRAAVSLAGWLCYWLRQLQLAPMSHLMSHHPHQRYEPGRAWQGVDIKLVRATDPQLLRRKVHFIAMEVRVSPTTQQTPSVLCSRRGPPSFMKPLPVPRKRLQSTESRGEYLQHPSDPPYLVLVSWYETLWFRLWRAIVPRSTWVKSAATRLLPTCARSATTLTPMHALETLHTSDVPDGPTAQRMLSYARPTSVSNAFTGGEVTHSIMIARSGVATDRKTSRKHSFAVQPRPHRCTV